MKVSATAPSRPALRYPGAKWLLAPWIISHFPQRAGSEQLFTNSVFSLPIFKNIAKQANS